MTRPLPRPRLSPGGLLQVIAASSPFDVDAFHAGVARLSERYQVRYDPGVLEREGFLAGSDDRRAAELIAALDDPAVQAIVPARGGYGATRILERIEPARVRRANKLLVGFSDVTALHALWARAGLGSIHGRMVASVGLAEPARVERWMRAVEGAPMAPFTGLETVTPGIASGRLAGGNLAVLCALCGTPHAPPMEGAVLFLEDVAERPYRVDRMLTTLQQAGWLARVAGVVLGAFTDAAPGPDGVEVGSVLRERLGTLGVPVAMGLPAGHVDDNHELPLGARVRLDADAGTLALEEDA